MKSFYSILIIVLFCNFIVYEQALTGDYRVGTGKYYTTIAAAIADLNAKGVGTGGVTFLVDAGHTETFSDDTKGKITATGTSANPIVFRKEGTGNNPVITTASNTQFEAIITISGGDYITIDGIDVIENVSNATGKVSYCYKITAYGTDGACYNTIKNCSVRLKNDLFGQHAICQISNAENTGKNDNNTYSNINITESREAIYLDGYSENSLSENCVIENCTIGIEADYKILYSGIEISHCGNITIKNNIIRNVFRSDGSCYGILYYNPPTDRGYTISLFNNKIYNINSNDYSGGYSIGISITNNSLVNTYNYIYNNTISGLVKELTSAKTAIYLKGIELLGGNSNNYIYHNSILINSNEYPSSRCLSLDAGKNTLYNNLFITTSGYNATSNRYELYCKASSNLISSNYNNFYFSSSGTNNIIGKVNTTNYTTLQDWVSGVTKDLNSVSQQVFFKSSTDLHLDGTSIGNTDLAGMNLSSLSLPGYDKDIDGESRNVSNPYMGADEDLTHPVPVELMSFTATKLSNSVNLYWNTKTEINCLRFDIERKYKYENNWNYITSVEGHGNSSNENEYSYTDNYFVDNEIQYRLKQIDTDGNYKFYYSNILDINIPSEFSLKQNYPNPFNPLTIIGFTLKERCQVSLRVYDILGREVYTLVNEFLDAGFHEIEFNAEALNSGVYFYRIVAGNYIDTKKMTLLR